MQFQYFAEITNNKTTYTRQSKTYKRSMKGVVGDQHKAF